MILIEAKEERDRGAIHESVNRLRGSIGRPPEITSLSSSPHTRCFFIDKLHPHHNWLFFLPLLPLLLLKPCARSLQIDHHNIQMIMIMMCAYLHLSIKSGNDRISSCQNVIILPLLILRLLRLLLWFHILFVCYFVVFMGIYLFTSPLDRDHHRYDDQVPSSCSSSLSIEFIQNLFYG